MPRTTVDIDAPILRDLKRLQKRERKSLGRLVSDLLAEALGPHRRQDAERREFSWVARPMDARVDLADKEAVRTILDRP
jgi:mRNA-degrading endonuclease RelE of RelBE toxin-antitoxin system